MSDVIKQITFSASQELVLADRRFFNYLLLNALEQGCFKKEYQIKFTQLCGVFSAIEPAYERILLACERILQVALTIDLDGKSLVLGLVQMISVDATAQVITYQFSRACFEIYQQADLLERCLIQAHFAAKYTVKLYELLAAHRFSQQYHEPLVIEINQLRVLLGVAQNKMKNFNDLLRFVLLPAIEEINLYASFSVKFDKIHEGRKVSALSFHLQHKLGELPMHASKDRVPMRRPNIFFENPKEDQAYSFLLNAPTKIRKQYFAIAKENALKKRKMLSNDMLDTPDVWFEYCKHVLSSKGE